MHHQLTLVLTHTYMCIYVHLVVAKRTLESSFFYGLITGLVGAATSYMALLMGA